MAANLWFLLPVAYPAFFVLIPSLLMPVVLFSSPCATLLVYSNALSRHPLFPFAMVCVPPSLTVSSVFHFSSQILQQLISVTVHTFLALHLSIPCCHRSEADFSLLPNPVWPIPHHCPNAISSSMDSTGEIVSQVSVPLFGAGKPRPILWSKTIFLGPKPKWTVWTAVFLSLTSLGRFSYMDEKGSSWLTTWL